MMRESLVQLIGQETDADEAGGRKEVDGSDPAFAHDAENELMAWLKRAADSSSRVRSSSNPASHASSR